MTQYLTTFQTHKNDLSTLQRIPLLKKIEEISNKVFTTDEQFKPQRAVLGEEKEKTVIRAAVEANFEGIEDFSEEFYKVYDVAVQLHRLRRELVQHALAELDHGFTLFETTLLANILPVFDAYDTFYKHWTQAVRTTKAAQKIIQLQKEDPDELEDLVLKNALDNHYTVIDMDEKEDFFHTPYAVYFADDIAAITKAFDDLLDALPQGDEQEQNYYTYLKQYRDALNEKDPKNLETVWTTLDEAWMDVLDPVQVVHDIEYGYGDPLRIKVMPDLSVRVLDTTYTEENKTIEEVKQLMIMHYGKRHTDLAKQGIRALERTHAGIYHVPFCTGMSYHFRWSGQNIPNRSTVKDKKGVKIFFDPEATLLRIKRVQDLVKYLYEDQTLTERIDHIDSIVNHIAAHEFAHAIYNLESLRGTIDTMTMSMLEEPRAELTALTTMKQMFEAGMLSQEQLEHSVFNFAAGDLRRFAMFESDVTRPYTISAINTYRVYEDTGYLRLKDNKLHVDDTKVLETLNAFDKELQEILEAEDEEDTGKLKEILTEMQEESDLVQWLVTKLKGTEWSQRLTPH